TGTVSAGDVVNASKVLNEAERNTLKLLLNAYLDRSKSGGWSVKGCVVSGQVLLNNAPFSNGKLTVKEIELLVEQIRAGL
ncbi:MAG TPA: hypothetical protein VNT60_05940, partial [Deinococcales bacterium]|nr:hypothetical protein [Deinococcales bacterium]